MKLRLIGITVLSLAFACSLGGRASADSDPASGVGRIASERGAATVRHQDGSADAATVNLPLLIGDTIMTSDDSRTELQFPDVAIRLAGQTQARLIGGDGTAAEMQLAVGTAIVKDYASNPNGTIDTPSVAVTSGGGSCRVSVDQSGVTLVTARSGQCLLTTPGGTVPVGANLTMSATGPAASPQITSVDLVPLDDFDGYAVERDQATAHAISQNTALIPSYAMYDDLSAYGTWVNVTGFGTVWHPNVGPDWAPYRLGTWVENASFGPTWVSTEPWGWIPYHYGRWFQSSDCGGWCWQVPDGFAVTGAGPGITLAARPPWAPALVAWVKNVYNETKPLVDAVKQVADELKEIKATEKEVQQSYVPLAPHETYQPWYNHSGFTALPLVSGEQLGTYSNAGPRAGTTSLPVATFSNGGHVAPTYTAVVSPVLQSTTFAKPVVKTPTVVVPTVVTVATPAPEPTPAFGPPGLHAVFGPSGAPGPVVHSAFGPSGSAEAPAAAVTHVAPTTTQTTSSVTRSAFGPTSSAPAAPSTAVTHSAFGPSAPVSTSVTHSAFGPSPSAPTSVVHSAFGPSGPSTAPTSVSHSAFGPSPSAPRPATYNNAYTNGNSSAYASPQREYTPQREYNNSNSSSYTPAREPTYNTYNSNSAALERAAAIERAAQIERAASTIQRAATIVRPSAPVVEPKTAVDTVRKLFHF